MKARNFESNRDKRKAELRKARREKSARLAFECGAYLPKGKRKPR